jgi:colanic acid/amylovoran biosynthesis glycosyltransferase
MKIAVIISEFPSLNETFVLDHITGLIDRGHDVDIYATAPAGLAKSHDEVKSYNLLNRTVYRDSEEFTLPLNWLLRAFKGVPLLAGGLLKNPRATLNSLNIFRLGRDASSLSALYRIAPFLNFSDYDIVHCHFLTNGHLAVFLRELGAIRGKIVTSFHGYRRRYFEKAGTKHRVTDLFQKGDLFLTCSEHMRRWFAGKGWGEEKKMIVHRCGVRVERFSAPRTKANPQTRLLSIGRLVEKKGFEYGIRAVAKIRPRFPEIRYEIVGDGPQKPKLEQLIVELGVANNVRLLGWKAREEVLPLLGEANVLLAPSVTSHHGDQEGIPVVLMEAMASELPVISTHHTGIPEVVDDGESGFLVPEKDVESMADRLTHLVKNREIRRAMGQKGRKHIEEHYDLDKQNDRLIEIYRSLLKQRSAFPFLPALLVPFLEEYLPFFVEIAWLTVP